MRSIGILLIVLGFGSPLLNAFDYEFMLLSWADPYQPWIGIGLGVVGLVVVVLTFTMGKREPEAEQPPAA